MLLEQINKIVRYPFFLYLLPIFFVFHGFIENYFLISVAACSLLLLKYLAATLIMHCIFFFLSKNNVKAVFYSFLLLVVYFFFGAFHDLVKSIFPNSLFAKYSFVLPFVLLIVVTSIIIIKRRKILYRPVIYLNILFTLFIFLDSFSLINKISSYDRQEQIRQISSEFVVCDSCYKPDVYLIVADEYAGEKTLSDIYRFDNSMFYRQLKERKFHIIKNSFSNYNITPLSIASLLNLDYPKLSTNNLLQLPMRPYYHLIDTNILIPFFLFNGYEFINNSFFQVNGQPQLAIQPFTPVSTRLIESQTLFSRLMRDMGYLLTKFNFSTKGSDEKIFEVMKNNNKVIENIKKQVVQSRTKPQFSYSHLTMPHFPYYFDSLGIANPKSELILNRHNIWKEEKYLSYLKYTNIVLLDLLDHILKHSATPPVIILISDHGFRLFSNKVDTAYHFYNLNATFLPDQYSQNFPDSISTLTYIRSLLNLLYQQQFDTDRQNKYFIPVWQPDTLLN